MKQNSNVMKDYPLMREHRTGPWLLGFGLLFLSVVGIPAGLFSQPLAAGQNKFLGCSSSVPVWPHLDQYWNQITPGNDGKWGSAEPGQGYFSWDNLDTIYNYAARNGFLFKEHNLVWGNQQPSWITSLDSADQRGAVQTWIQTICQRYPTLSFIDVVNEPFHAPPPYAKALGGNGATGWDWVVTAFQWARQYAPAGTKLLVNDYNILQDNTTTTNYLHLVDTLMVRGLIDGIGIQGHYFEFRSPLHATSNNYVYSVSTIKSNLDRLTATGLPVYISEFAINEQNDSDQLAEYQIYFPLFWSDPGVKGMTLWGYIQNDVWSAEPYAYLLHTDGTERPVVQWLRTFIRYGPTPNAPLLVSPRNATNVAKQATFTWRSAQYALTYELQVALDQAFTLVLEDTTLADTTKTIGFALDDTTTFYWRVAGIDSAGPGPYSVVARFNTGTALDVKEADMTPKEFSLSQNYPNPFNPTTLISFQLPASGFVRLRVFDLLGKEVATLAEGERPAGSYQVSFDGSRLSSGIYLYRLEAGELTITKKLVLLK